MLSGPSVLCFESVNHSASFELLRRKRFFVVPVGFRGTPLHENENDIIDAETIYPCERTVVIASSHFGPDCAGSR